MRSEELKLPSEEDTGKDEEALEDKAAMDGERVAAAEVAAFMEAVDCFQPNRGMFEKVADAGEVVGKHRTDRPSQEEGQGHGGQGRRT